MGTGTFGAATRETGGGRAFGPGPSTRFTAAAVVALAVAAALVVILAPSGRHPARSTGRVVSYGWMPAWLPKVAAAAPKLEVARPATPVLREQQGYTVHAELPGGSADVTAVGPQIPRWVAGAVQSGKRADGEPVQGTFMVTLAAVRGRIPVAARAFSILTDSGEIVHPRVTVRGAARLPAALHSGQHLTLMVRAGVSDGSGSIRWAPLGTRVLVGWIYQLELD